MLLVRRLSVGVRAGGGCGQAQGQQTVGLRVGAGRRLSSSNGNSSSMPGGDADSGLGAFWRRRWEKAKDVPSVMSFVLATGTLILGGWSWRMEGLRSELVKQKVELEKKLAKLEVEREKWEEELREKELAKLDHWGKKLAKLDVKLAKLDVEREKGEGELLGELERKKRELAGKDAGGASKAGDGMGEMGGENGGADEGAEGDGRMAGGGGPRNPRSRVVYKGGVCAG